MNILFFDTETSDMYNFKKSYKDSCQPQMVQFGGILVDKDTRRHIHEVGVITNTVAKIAPTAEEVHGISVEMLQQYGLHPRTGLCLIADLLMMADLLVCHNVNFDIRIMRSTFHRYEMPHMVSWLKDAKTFCTMHKSTKYCGIKGKRGVKWPKLIELHHHLFGEYFDGAHDALGDVQATERCFWELVDRGVFEL